MERGIEQSRRRVGERLVANVERQQALDRATHALSRALENRLERLGTRRRQVENFLHGTWLGHPLHAVLSDVPLGSWTAALVFDALDALSSRPGGYRRAADGAIVIGCAGAIGAAASGAADWRHLSHSTQRVGLVHGAVNTAALGAYVTSLILRRKRHRGKARLAAAIGYGLATASGYLGGSMVYRHRAGVDHAEDRARPEAFVPVLADDELTEGAVRRVDAGGVRAVLVRQDGRVRALGEVCPHLGGPLADGTLEGNGVRCPWHGSRFSLDDGRVLDGPATAPAPCFETRIRDGHIEIRSAGGSHQAQHG